MTFFRFQLKLWRELRGEVVGRTHGQPKSRRAVRFGEGGGSVFVTCGRSPPTGV